MTLEQLHRFAVGDPRFRLSRTRRDIMSGLWTIAACLCRWQIHGDLWLDGSFLTEKIDPKDVDFVMVTTEGFIDTMTPEQEAIVDWLFEDRQAPAKAFFLCDSYAFHRVPAGHPAYVDSQGADAYWKKQFGFSRESEAKGMVLLSVPDGCR